MYTISICIPLENISMSQKPTHEELKQRVKDFEKMAADHERTDGESVVAYYVPINEINCSGGT